MGDHHSEGPLVGGRLTTGVPGLDTILGGGLLPGNLYLVAGHPGAGKTILGNQLCFHLARQGFRTVFLTVLSETHEAMVMHLRDLAFFDEDVLADGMRYYSAYSPLDEGGTDGLLDFVVRILTDEQPDFIVLDGMASAEAIAGDVITFKRFVRQLQVYSTASGCTMVLLSHDTESSSRPIHTMVDGIFCLTERAFGLRTARELQVLKFRGAGFIRGRHFYSITDQGVSVFPRVEAVYGHRDKAPFDSSTRVPFGIEQLDDMLQGGLHAASTAVVAGNVGSGKTMLGLHFLATGAASGDHGHYVGFSEPCDEIIAKGDAAGLEFTRLEREGMLEVGWEPPVEVILDPIAQRIFEGIERKGTRRLFIDGVQGLQHGVIYRERVPLFFMALAHELRRRGVTTLISTESATHHGPPDAAIPYEVSNIAGTVINLRQVERGARIHRLVNIAKMRHGRHDTTIREFSIGVDGFTVAASSDGAAHLLGSRDVTESSR
jgi:circadian clock protein KaiC